MQCFAHFSLFCALKSRVMKKNIAIFASGSGSNAENIIRYFQKSGSAQVSLVLSNKSDAYVLERAHRLRVPCNVFPKEDWIAGDEILAVLQEARIDFIVLAGFLFRVPDLLLHAYPYKIINIHPALLPKYGGKGMYGDRVHQAVVTAGEKESGITIHYINEHYDEGDTIFQVTCPVLPTDSPDDVAKKVHALEYEHFPLVIEKLLNEK
ncbi:phosphoribosylglycinamide formyltransferase [Bacteroides acidifaciens]|uniref:Phosphoribosylglycinamide formyltransferase n=1 Tax=Bacteroides acidifaciens TaxID=85831 RepID=A0A7K3MEN9_9BACE|nr:phosphoribosylglycinamide formyltransferase [Bacteroides acidifaciens]MBF0728984.1 phosphoribosylglycinamide formyltransferase [Bacteroides acidifaciens]MBF0837123.1 phosphoribosylglycinamide formyltransferase [Bacteroides acidifaciens]MCR1996362.1 phosphoribosylglycinamide formyltransferase [Bacteroides acidifaciens]NDO52921.1 phosphoribosylglycinamide formyltransferase [Bacteroides acidifaciens]TFU51460.1 phosphoribosylglycinamide formyltransferase [Bacteroides acidifaciens]